MADTYPPAGTVPGDVGSEFPTRPAGADTPTVTAGPPFPDHPEYEPVRELGRGGMGVVYLARNTILGRLEALKVVAWPGPGVAERFLGEIRAAARLSHPNVVTAYAAHRVGGRLVFAMEYVDGPDLYRVVRSGGPLPARRACEYARQAALALEHAHEKGMVHRDVKPHNLILARDGGREVVKVLDFGLAKASSERPVDPGLTPELAVLGTPEYLAPEQAADAGRADTRADIYGLGCTLYFLLTGRPPFAGGSVFEVVRRHRDEEPFPLAAPGVPAGLVGVVSKMMAKDPADRYQSPKEAADALAPFAAGESPPPAPRPTKRRWWVTAGLAAAGLVVVVGAWAARPDPPAVTPPGPAADGFVPIFNGRDLSGWAADGGDPAGWRVEDGVIVAGGRGWLLSDREYRDFVLRFEYQLDRGGNAGIALRAVPGERPALKAGKPAADPLHLQVELSDDADPKWVRLPTGQVNGAASTRGAALKPVRPAPPRRPDGWAAVGVELRGQALRVTIDGVVVQDADLDALVGMGSRYPGLRRAAGRVGFQRYDGTVRFRNVAVRELPPGG